MGSSWGVLTSMSYVFGTRNCWQVQQHKAETLEVGGSILLRRGGVHLMSSCPNPKPMKTPQVSGNRCVYIYYNYIQLYHMYLYHRRSQHIMYVTSCIHFVIIALKQDVFHRYLLLIQFLFLQKWQRFGTVPWSLMIDTSINWSACGWRLWWCHCPHFFQASRHPSMAWWYTNKWVITDLCAEISVSNMTRGSADVRMATTASASWKLRATSPKE